MKIMSKPEKHDFIERCPYCQKFMTTQQLKKHKCEGTEFSGMKEIPVRHIYGLTEDEGKVIIAHGYDGIMYSLFETTIPFSGSSYDGSYHEGQNRRKVNRTFLKCLK
jgi:hypothetical protein